ncbi:nuclease-related domain-containing protein [Arthrobacter sp. PsM3]|uniref:nuclease-related domain-containing protein n=1 Tax=Arthrobacter sp. PsM3 TaxID=3030531 RepID=UPI00263BC2C8|nr:nuclease-related domain-containing protein [Arthrobacter sp. PsM3]MDN4644274.1 nuclease-related domain-containing protein [Arthrobacter sp. PsM3]
MAAGDRAAEQSRLAAERVQRLRRQLEHAERNAHAWSVGAAGEALVAERMTELGPDGWLTLHDVHWPGRPKANLDHVLVGPGGILVVDAKNWSGDVRLRDGILRQNGYSREREVSGVLQQSAALAAVLEPDHRRLVQGWICVVGQPELQGTTASGIRIEGLDTLGSAVAGLPTVLDPTLVPAIHRHLQGLLGGAASPQLLTTAQFDVDDAPAASLQHWRTRPAPATRNLIPLRKTRLRKPRGRSKGPGCGKVLLQMTLLIVGVSMLLNFAANYRPTAPTTPRPSPSISQTVPAR